MYHCNLWSCRPWKWGRKYWVLCKKGNSARQFCECYRFVITKCGKFRIFLSLRICVKSVLENVKVEKIANFCNFRSSVFLMWVNYSFQKMQRLMKNQDSELVKSIKLVVFGHLKSLKLFSRKIWVAFFYAVFLKGFFLSNYHLLNMFYIK